MAAQHAARFEAEFVDAGLQWRAVLLVEKLGDLLLALVQRRADQVRRRLVVVDLEDVLAEIGLDDGQAGGFDRVIQARLLGDHRLRFDDLLHRMRGRDFEEKRIDVSRGLGEEYGGAPRSSIALEHREPGVEIVERALADRPRRVARALEVVEFE